MALKGKAGIQQYEEITTLIKVLHAPPTTFFNDSQERCKSSRLATDSNVGSYNSWIGARVRVPLLNCISHGKYKFYT